jgi:hypothetical protein
LASEILENIKKFFEKPEFTNQQAAIREYVYWALRPGGPAYFSKPTPKEVKGSGKDKLGNKVCQLRYTYIYMFCGLKGW